ncbi:MAG: 4Fe-4S dicluster domain-containing protein [Pirellulaceae bacterium]
MPARTLPLGCSVVLAKDELQTLIDRLRQRGYRTVAPQVADGAIIYDDLDRIDRLPLGMLDEQDGGRYRLRRDANAGYFDYVVGPNSLKNYVFPPREPLLEAQRKDGQWEMQTIEPPAERLAVIGVRSCDLHALAVQDRVFLEGPYVDPAYKARRERLLLVAVNCRRAAATCFCHSMKTGPAVKSGFDLALTELEDSFVVEVGSERGGEILAECDWIPATSQQAQQAQETPRRLARQMAERATAAEEGANRSSAQRSLDTKDIRDLLLGNLEHPRWQEVAERCLACGNCTLVCPTCFCSVVEEVSDLTGDHVTRERSWASCFTADHSYMNSGAVHKSTASRYRQWLTHKLASWIDQFDVSGCVGCGRCITWCPVGIDLTEEVAAIREEA